jgi:hypothetical protein
MTAKQRAARAKFKAVVAEAKKLRKKNPKLTQAQAVKQAWAISYSKERGGKKLGEYHKDTKSHNVNIRVVSGIKINYKRGKLGALPVGFTGSVLGLKFRVYNQFNLDGTVTAQVVEDDPKGYLIVEINGRPGEAKAAANKFYATIGRNVTDDLSDKDEKVVKSRIFKFLDQLSKEVKAYNSGKDTRTKKNEKLTISKQKEKKPTTVKDKIKHVLRSDKKRLKYGYTIVPGKVMAGIDTDVQRQMNMYKGLVERAKEAEKRYKKEKDPGIKYLYKLTFDRLKNEIRERKFVMANMMKELKKLR